MRGFSVLASAVTFLFCGVTNAAAIPRRQSRYDTSVLPTVLRRDDSILAPLPTSAASLDDIAQVVTTIAIVEITVTVAPDTDDDSSSPSTATTTSYVSDATTVATNGVPQIVLAPFAATKYDSTNTFSTTSASGTSRKPLVFAHYMLLTRPKNGDYSNDIALAQKANIDAFAVNYGGWNVDYKLQQQYLTEIYAACASKGFKAFLSVDLTSTSQTGEKMSAQHIVSLYNSVASKPAQMQVEGKPVLSTFQSQNPSWNWQSDVLSKLDQPAYFLPSTLSDNAYETFDQTIGADGHFPWIHPHKTAAEESVLDQAMAASRDRTGKKWMAALSPWFFKRFDAGNNWAHAQDGDIFLTRALELLVLQPDFIELVTWNDWGESTYFGPADDANTCTQCYWAKQSHSGALEIVTAIIKAYKAGQTSITQSSEENVWLYYRLQPANKLDAAGKYGLPLPLDADQWTNQVFVVGLFDVPTEVTVTSGSQTKTITMPAGLSQQSMPWSLGAQSVSASRAGTKVVSRKTGPSIAAQLEKYNGNVVFV